MKKDFSQISTDRVYNAITEATQETRKPRKTYTAQEAQEIQETLHTSGRKGVKLSRINMGFTPSNYEYITTMARVSGQNMTEFVNKIIADHRTDHADTYQKALEFKASL